MKTFFCSIIVLLSIAFGVALAANTPRNCAPSAEAGFDRGYLKGVTETTQKFRGTME